MNIAFKIKSWQLFLLLFLPSFFIKSTWTLIIVPLFVLTIISFWSLSIGVLGQKKISDLGLKNHKTIFFKIACIFMPMSWLIIAIDLYKVIDFGELSYLIEHLLFPFSFIFIFSSIYMIYFVSKTISSLNLRKGINLPDFIVTIILLVFFPVGLWIIQPKLNKIEGK
jgi:hypothetical protein